MKGFQRGQKKKPLSLLMCGLMFGSLKLKELYYASKILSISDEPNFTFEQPQTQENRKTRNNQPKKQKQKLKFLKWLESFDVNSIFKINVVIGSLHKSLKTKIIKLLNGITPKKS
ncbi:MAG: hypothetical protein IPO47_01400 [Bacteroidetes bacterium]|nr:hypothetical protein [Bacteroidota bacterium]